MPQDEIPPPPKTPSIHDGRAWYHIGPVILELAALICTTILVMAGKVPNEEFKYLIGILVGSKIVARFPSFKIPPGGGGVTMLALGAFRMVKGLWS